MSRSSLPQMDSHIMTSRGYNPIHELMRAMILRAVEDYQAGGELREDALRYFNGDDGDEDDTGQEVYVLSFAFICKHLGLDPKKTREAILNADHRISTRRRAA